jgi:hypothetical protein
MRMHKIALVVALALAGIPAGALAAKPSHPTTPASTNANANANATTTASLSGKSAGTKVQFVLRGTLSAYTAANGTANGTVSLTVKSSNFDSKTLKRMTMTFVVNSKTKVVLHDGKAIANGVDTGVVKLRAAKNNATWTGLIASQVIDQGTAS